MDSSGISVTTVHGTFAKNATWVADSSSFSKALRARFGTNVVVEPFRWSGKNKLMDRIAYADELNQHLKDQRCRHPGKQQFLIGHSHGGSVISYCFKKYPNWAKEIKGTVFLATPIFIARERVHWESLIRVVKFSIYLAVHFVVMLLLWDVSNFSAKYAGVSVITGTFITIHYVFYTKSFRVKEHTKISVKEKVDAINIGKIVGRNFLFIGHPKDEVKRLFVFLDGFTQLLGKLSKKLVPSIEKVLERDWQDRNGKHPPGHRYALPIVTLLLAISIGPIFYYGDSVSPVWPSYSHGIASLIDDLDSLAGFVTIFMLCFAALFIGFVLIAMLMLTLVFILIILSYALYGEFDPSYAFGIELSLSSDAGRKYQSDNIKWGEYTKQGRAHSLVYEDSSSVKVIVNWIDSIT